MSRWGRLQSNATDHTTTITHTICEPAFHTFGDLPYWINPYTTLGLVTHNFQGIKPIDTNEKLQSNIVNMVSLLAGITCLTKTNGKWRNYYFMQGYKNAFKKLYAASSHTFSSSS
jgi:hypothetical protein